ncbi:MAG: hypothetical protein K8S98_13685 [Planctomycetes bacterium]|nr:hypothetical protein [Planctomycetota bacterium]
MKQSRWITLAFLVAAAPLARAQSEAVFGKDDAEFVRRLSASGYKDLAESFAAVMRTRGTIDSADGLKLAVIDLALRMEKVTLEPDLAKRRDELESILKAKLDLIAQYPRSEDAQNERNTLPEVYRILGETYASMVGEEADAAKKRQLKDKAQEVFSEATRGLEERMAQFKRLMGDPSAADVEYLETQYRTARYNAAKTFYYNSKIYGPDEANRKDRLNKAVAALEDFTLDYQNSADAYEAYIYLGFCRRDLGKTDDALLDFDETIALASSWGPPNQIPEDAQSFVADLTGYAILQKVKLLAELKRIDDAKAAADWFFTEVPKATGARDALGIYAALAVVYSDADDATNAGTYANKLIELDPDGPYGGKGREILSKLLNGGGGGSVSAENLLLIAGQNYRTKDYDKALRFAAMARDAARGTKSEEAIGAQALETTAEIYRVQDQLAEATVALDAVYELYPKSDRAPEALFFASNYYDKLYQKERRQFFRKRYEDRRSTLAKEYPESPRAISAIMGEGEQLEKDKAWLKAVDFYKTFKAGTAGYELGLSKAATCYYNYARELWTKDSKDEAVNAFKQAEETAKLCQSLVDKKRTESLDTNVTQSASGLAFTTRLLRARIALQPAVDRPNDVFTLLKDLENDLANTPAKVAAVWNLRIQALQSQGKLDEASAMLLTLRDKDPDSEAVASAAGVLARAYDNAGVEAFKKDPKSRQGLDSWKKAAEYYWLSIAREFTKTDGTAIDDQEMEQVAGRFFIFAKEFNGIPEDVPHDTFVLGDERAVREPEYFEKAVQVFDLLARTSSSEKRSIQRARCYGFLGKFKEAAEALDGLFAEARFIDTTGATPRIDPRVSKVRPGLIYAFLDWGVADLLAGASLKETDRINRSLDRFRVLISATTSDSGLWWGAKTYQIRALFETGKYPEAALLMRELERNTEQTTWTKFGYGEKLLKVRARLVELGHMTVAAPPEKK